MVGMVGIVGMGAGTEPGFVTGAGFVGTGTGDGTGIVGKGTDIGTGTGMVWAYVPGGIPAMGMFGVTLIGGEADGIGGSIVVILIPGALSQSVAGPFIGVDGG